MTDLLTRCLDDLASRIDEKQEERVRGEWERFVHGRWEADVFRPTPRAPAPPRFPWPKVSVNKALADYEAMLLQQFGGCSNALSNGSGSILNVRCNYGTPILPSLFGVELFYMPEESDTLPANHPLRDSDAIRRLVDAGVPDIRAGLGDKVFTAAGHFQAALERYPVLKRHVDIYHPDVQGPIDVVEVVWGSEMFLAFEDEPGLMRDFLKLVTETYIAFMREWYRLVPPAADWSSHWGVAHRGRLMIRNDSLMNLSPETYIEFIRPMDQRLFDEFGGGAIHYCGRGDHFIAALSELRGLWGVNLSQPHLNNMETIYRHTVDKGIALIGLKGETVAAAGRPLHGLVHTG